MDDKETSGPDLKSSRNKSKMWPDSAYSNMGDADLLQVRQENPTVVSGIIGAAVPFDESAAPARQENPTVVSGIIGAAIPSDGSAVPPGTDLFWKNSRKGGKKPQNEEK